MWVAKIGGSLGGTDALVAWLAAFVADGERAWLLVPGGGAYADLVRDSQRRWHYPDAEAHGMALQAMALYASELMAIEPRLEVCDGVAMCGAQAGRWPRLWRPALAVRCWRCLRCRPQTTRSSLGRLRNGPAHCLQGCYSKPRGYTSGPQAVPFTHVVRTKQSYGLAPR